MRVERGFVRHVIPGSFIFIYGIWSTFQILLRYYEAVLLRPGSYTNTMTFTRKNRKPIDVYYIFLTAVLGVPYEMYGSSLDLKTKDKFFHHATNYMFPQLLAITMFLRLRKWKVPENLEYFLLILFFSSHAILFYFHLENSSFDTAVHTFMCYNDLGIIICIVLEVYNPESILAALSKQCFLIGNATYYYITAVLLDPFWSSVETDEEDPLVVQTVPLYFAWNIIFSGVLVAVIGAWQYRQVRNFKAGGSKRFLMLTDDDRA